MSERAIRLATAVLALAGIAVAAYIAISEAGGGAPACIAGAGGCETVAESDYSELAGVNVSVVGIFGYGLILCTAFLGGDLGRIGGLTAGIVGFGFTVYLTYLELFEIDAICQWCVVSAAVMTLLFAATAWRAVSFGARPPDGRLF